MPWNPGDMTIDFLYMGKGDCTVITLPNGHHIMVDAGSSKGDGTALDDAFNHLNNNLLRTGAIDQLEALILTHPDKDHYNRVEWMLRSTTRTVTIDNVYFGDLASKVPGRSRVPLGSYGIRGTHNFLVQNCPLANITGVSLNGIDDRVYKWNYDAVRRRYSQIPYNNALYTAGGHRLDGPIEVATGPATPNGKDWGVYIIAGNNGDAAHFNDPIPRNASSLVVLIKYGANQILLCGDANTPTENYITGTPRYQVGGAFALDNDINLMQVPHHGSSKGSSGVNFLTFLSPNRAVISCHAQDTHDDHHPRQIVVDRYLGHVHVLGGGATHPISFWEPFRFGASTKRDRRGGGTKALTFTAKAEKPPIQTRRAPVNVALPQTAAQVEANEKAAFLAGYLAGFAPRAVVQGINRGDAQQYLENTNRDISMTARNGNFDITYPD